MASLAVEEEEQKDGHNAGVTPFRSEPELVPLVRGGEHDVVLLRNQRSQSLDVGGSITMRAKMSGSSRRRHSRPHILKKIRQSMGSAKHKSQRSDDSVSGYSTTSTAFPDPEAEVVCATSVADLAPVYSPSARQHAAAGNSGATGAKLTSPRSRRKSSIVVQQVLQQQHQQLLGTQQQQQDRIARFEALLEEHASRQTTALQEISSLRASVAELSREQRALAERLASDRAATSQLVAVGGGCFVTGCIVVVVAAALSSFGDNATEAGSLWRSLQSGRPAQLALSVGLVWVAVGLGLAGSVYMRPRITTGAKTEKARVARGQTSPSTPEASAALLGRTGSTMAVATPPPGPFPGDAMATRTRASGSRGTRHDSQPLSLGSHARSSEGGSSFSRRGAAGMSEAAKTPGQHATVGENDVNDDTFVSSEYGISHEVWLNHFDGMDVRLEDCLHYKEMSPEQAGVFKEFRKEVLQKLGTFEGIDRRLPYPVPDDFSIMRFLQADKYNKSLASERLLSTLVWRQKTKLHELVSRPPAKLETYRRLRVRKCMGWSKKGMPIFVERIGEFITSLSSDLAKTMTVRDWLDCYMYEMAGLILEFRRGAAQGNVQWKMLFIADMRGVKFMQAFRSMTLLKAFAKEVEVHFPEQAGPVFLINTPSVVHSAWKLAKQFLDPVVLAKIQLHPNAATNVLLEHMDEDVLFKEYGGKNEDHFPHVEAHSL